MDEKPNKIRRKQFLIKKRFQLKYTGLILLFMFLVAWATGYTVYYTGWLLMGEKLANVYPQGRLVLIMRTINLTLLLRILFITPLVILISIILSHRIAGPIYRIQKYLRDIAAGNLSMRLHLRKNDEMQDLAAVINDMTDDLRNRANRLKGLANMANLEIEKLKISLRQESPDINGIRKEVEELAKSIKDLENYLSEYRLTTHED